MMLVFGKHRGMALETLILREPGYVAWMLAQAQPTHYMRDAQGEVARLIEIFDRKPIVARCQGEDCDSSATRCTLYRGSAHPRWWCDKCDLD
jgi:hypothetical protein